MGVHERQTSRGDLLPGALTPGRMQSLEISQPWSNCDTGLRSYPSVSRSQEPGRLCFPRALMSIDALPRKKNLRCFDIENKSFLKLVFPAIYQDNMNIT